uniref:Uncharacterized protein n=1 Tax=Cacopsylla melanoneura TaxID=428564 RepID=A0A8D8XM97_9HEMI
MKKFRPNYHFFSISCPLGGVCAENELRTYIIIGLIESTGRETPRFQKTPPHMSAGWTPFAWRPLAEQTPAGGRAPCGSRRFTSEAVEIRNKKLTKFRLLPN